MIEPKTSGKPRVWGERSLSMHCWLWLYAVRDNAGVVHTGTRLHWRDALAAVESQLLANQLGRIGPRPVVGKRNRYKLAG